MSGCWGFERSRRPWSCGRGGKPRELRVSRGDREDVDGGNSGRTAGVRPPQGRIYQRQQTTEWSARRGRAGPPAAYQEAGSALDHEEERAARVVSPVRGLRGWRHFAAQRRRRSHTRTARVMGRARVPRQCQNRSDSHARRRHCGSPSAPPRRSQPRPPAGLAAAAPRCSAPDSSSCAIIPDHSSTVLPDCSAGPSRSHRTWPECLRQLTPGCSITTILHAARTTSRRTVRA